ncbi:MAG: hypothetical protein HeimC3_45460 [Candidatus Heimdallarchaeota archaeon LC_3]|nr:MAG: hypothetical protein HeimC3_45460 [Candidatus Heimdallarchaeota archaeon LC_3]
MSSIDHNVHRNRLSYKLGGYSFIGFITGLVLFIIGMLVVKPFGNEHFVPLGLIGLGMLIFGIGILIEILTFIVAITE